MLHRQPSGLERIVETVAGRRCRHDDHRALSVAAVKGLREVALLGFGRQTRRGASALYVHDHQRQLGHHGQSQRFALERESGTRRGRHREIAGECRADGGADARDLVFGLHGLHAEVLALGELFENDRRRSDRIRTAEERQPGFLGGGAQAPCRRHVAVDGAVGALFERRRGHGVGVGELMGVGRIVIARVDSQLVGFCHDRIFPCEFGLQIFVCVRFGTVEEVEADAQREHVLALDHGLVVQSGLLERFARHRRDVGDDDVVFVQSELRDRIERGESRFLEMLFGDRIAVDDHRRALLEPFAVGFERCGVHGYEHVAVVAGVEFAVTAEVYLKSRYAGHGSLRRTNFGGVVRKGRDAVSEQGRSV